MHMVQDVDDDEKHFSLDVGHDLGNLVRGFHEFFFCDCHCHKVLENTDTQVFYC